MVLKLGDFGLAIDIATEKPVTRAGTLDYMVSGQRDARACEIISIGPWSQDP
jgi:hypothetical protein